MGKFAENPRYHVISLRVSDEERETIEAARRLAGKSLAVFGREILVQGAEEMIDERDSNGK